MLILDFALECLGIVAPSSSECAGGKAYYMKVSIYVPGFFSRREDVLREMAVELFVYCVYHQLNFMKSFFGGSGSDGADLPLPSSKRGPIFLAPV